MTTARPVLWTPNAERIRQSRMDHFRRVVEQRENVSLEDYEALRRWSVREIEAFWSTVWDELEIVGVKGERIVEGSKMMPGAEWFPDARLSYAENLLRFDGDRTALVSWNEAGPRSSLSYGELRRRVAELAAALRGAGVRPGDRVGAYLPNITETLIAMLATNAVGAVWSSCSPDFGVQAALDRLGQIEPVVLFTTDAYRYAGKAVSLSERVAELLRGLPSVRHCIGVPYLNDQLEIPAVGWGEFLSRGRGAELEFERAPFGQPAFILFSSGTTGLPKCIVHGAGGTLLQHAKEHALHTDISRDDAFFYYTTCGWMMWNWLATGLAQGAKIVLYEGSPFHARDDVLWEMAEKEGVSVFGTSAKYLALAEKRGLRPGTDHGLSALRAVLSTGSTLLPAAYDYVYREIKQDLQLSSISGGTDLISCFALGNPTLPVVREELQCRGLGMAVEVWDAGGNPTEEAGELVCTKPFPSMPVSFWDDQDGSRYRAAYFEYYPGDWPGVWRHGDWVELTPSGGMVVHGRSDATLNPGGVRIGTAEIYRVVEQMREIVESVVVGEKWNGDVRVALFVRLAEGAQLDSELEERIRVRVRKEASPHHVPRRIEAVPDIPRTVSGKISEIAVRKKIDGEALDNTDALANPESLRWFEPATKG